MIILGHLALALAFGVAIATALVGIAAGRSHVLRWASLSRYGVYLQCGLIALASAVLLHAFLDHDFSLRYVYNRADTRMPIGYLMASFWSGQEGSLLFWVGITSIFGALAAWFNRDRLPHLMPWFHAMLSLLLAGFLYILVFVTNPFDSWVVIDVPLEGTGLKAALRNPLMTIHPPMLLSGFATFAIPWAFGMAALLSGDTGSAWLRATRRWTLISWMLLGVGNILGGMWAYVELGWGGYWAWDPVENAGLLPWLTATAFLHSVIIQEQRGMLKKWNIVLVLLTFLLTLFGTFITRSGLIDSVHTFAESEIGDYFFMLLCAATALSVGVAAARWKLLETEHRIEHWASRESAFLANNWLFVGMTFVVLWGTMFPKMREMITGTAVAIGPPWFNRFMAPLGLVLLLLMAVGTLVPWRRTRLATVARHFTTPVVITLAVTPVLAVAWWFTRGQVYGIEPFTTPTALALLTVALIIFNVVTLGVEFHRGARARSRDRSWLAGILSLFRRHRRRYGGYVVHLGATMIFLAFVGNWVKLDRQLVLQVGESIELADYVITFERFDITEQRDHILFQAVMTLSRDGREIGTLLPSRADFNDYSMLGDGRPDPLQLRSNIFIRSNPLEDVYVALLNFEDGGNAGAFKFTILPFTWWFWFGGFILMLGTFICVWPERERWRASGAALRRAGQVLIALLATTWLLASPGTAMATEAPAPPGAASQVVDETEDVHAGDPASRDWMRSAGADAYRAFRLIMTTCEGCAGKTLAIASPSCALSNVDKERIVGMEAQGMSLDEILAVFVDERGEAALAIPPDRGINRLAWIMPLALMLLGGLLITVLSRRWSGGGTRDRDGAGHDEPDFAPGDEPMLARLREEVATGEGTA
ncbi:MAG: heme lyase CcmF/NrfE family subunit [Deltaproteobacteria bacterium]|nr:MAG: heme lyase CcmF/NrfE family subunit [Deltaproteobacteria bacterium]